MPQSMIGFVLTLLIGVCIAYVNYRLTAKSAKNPTGQFAVVSLVRQFLNFGYLAAVFFVAPLTPWDRTWMLVGAVLGVTLPLFVFTFLLLRQVNAERNDRAEEETKGGEK